MAIPETTWHKPCMEYQFRDTSHQYRVLTDCCNFVSAIWINGRHVVGDCIFYEEKVNEILKHAKIYGVWARGLDVYVWNSKELTRISKLQERKRS